MVDFDTAAAAVQDPDADPVFLAKIAYENPEFGANVVANPRAYPGLKRWVAQFGDERVGGARQTVLPVRFGRQQTGPLIEFGIPGAAHQVDQRRIVIPT